jgi:DNA-binding FadR family transcriptional regulator
LTANNENHVDRSPASDAIASAPDDAGIEAREDSSALSTSRLFQSIELRPLKVVNTFEEALAEIMKMIKLGMVLPGERLLPERELAQRLEISRPTVREAIRALTQTGYLETRRGRNGGAYVKEPPADPSSASVRRAAAELGQDLAEIFDLRGILEPGASALAAERATAADKALLDNALKTLALAPRLTYPPSERPVRDDPAPASSMAPADLPLSYRRADQRLHLLIAEVARSPALARLIAEVNVRLSDLIRMTPQMEAALRHSDEQHLRIVNAIKRGDRNTARRATEEHVASTATYIRGFLE